jgi:hypothetical protein
VVSTLFLLTASCLTAQGDLPVLNPPVYGPQTTLVAPPPYDNAVMMRGYAAPAPWLRMRMTTNACFRAIPTPLEPLGDPPGFFQLYRLRPMFGRRLQSPRYNGY